MTLYQNGQPVTDAWQILDATGDIPTGGKILVPLARFVAERAALCARNGAIGVTLAAGEKFDALLPDLARIELIRLVVPKYTDGRAYSTARLLRERHGYTGLLRAAGDVLTDQLTFFHRCGFDQLEITDPATLAVLNADRHVTVHHYYQPAAPGLGETDAGPGTRPWLRRPAGAGA